MTTMNSVLDMQSSHTELGKQIVSSVVAKINQGKAADAVDHFGSVLKFNDHALGLEFNDKARLEEFFNKTRELFPDAHLNVTAIFESGNHVVEEWTLTATHVELFWPRNEFRVRRSLPGVSIVAITGGQISEWSDYYDSRTASRSRLADFSPNGENCKWSLCFPFSDRSAFEYRSTAKLCCVMSGAIRIFCTPALQ